MEGIRRLGGQDLHDLLRPPNTTSGDSVLSSTSAIKSNSSETRYDSEKVHFSLYLSCINFIAVLPLPLIRYYLLCSSSSSSSTAGYQQVLDAHLSTLSTMAQEINRNVASQSALLTDICAADADFRRAKTSDPTSVKRDEVGCIVCVKWRCMARH